MQEIPQQQIRAVYDADTIRVYQAYGDAIADAALANGTFVSPPFSMTRMTWIKPSFLWMMYRAGWGFKDDGQRRILAIDITHDGFAWALSHSCASHPPPGMSDAAWTALKDASPVRVQWDPERDMHHNPLPHRAIQIGLSKDAVRLYAGEWIKRIAEVTGTAHAVHALVKAGKLDDARTLLPAERPYPEA
ncbi:MAG TPA: DUF4291 domain-containing protein [Rhizomicrobium sp.]|jgi:hypothetical protein|nr:DUF4291 domain-containing protein [Rhizomicrobium sp.]